MAIPWHRSFGMALTQYFAGTAWQVDVEVDLSLQQQRLDIVILRRLGLSPPPVWPDGFGTPADYNLLRSKRSTIRWTPGQSRSFPRTASPIVS